MDKDNLEEQLRKEVLKTVDKKIPEKKMQKLLKEAMESIDFLKKVDEIDIPSENYVVFTDGKVQLLYENGEFYLIYTTDSTRPRIKKTKKQATDLYLDWFIRYQLNPVLDLKQASKETRKKEAPTKEKKTVSKPTHVKEKSEVILEQQATDDKAKNLEKADKSQAGYEREI